MQYAVVQDRLLAAEELSALRTWGEDIRDLKIPEESMALRLVYGSFKPQVGETPGDSMEETRSNLDSWYGTIRGRQCVPGVLVDIEFHDPLFRGLAVDIPFAALMRTSLRIGQSRKMSTPFFLRYRGMSPAENLLNRPGILCVYRQENRPKGMLSDAGWRNAYRPERPLQCARCCQ